MIIRNAAEDDIPAITDIFCHARSYMKENGNPTQWGPDYPGIEVVKRDIQNGNCYVFEDENEIVGTFSFIMGEEPTYQIIEQGGWHDHQPYGTIHRLAGNGKRKGLAKACFDFCKKKIGYLRIDTHADNKPMQAAIQKAGFQKCGIIFVENGTERIAFDLSTQTG